MRSRNQLMAADRTWAHTFTIRISTMSRICPHYFLFVFVFTIPSLSKLTSPFPWENFSTISLELICLLVFLLLSCVRAQFAATNWSEDSLGRGSIARIAALGSLSRHGHRLRQAGRHGKRSPPYIAQHRCAIGTHAIWVSGFCAIFPVICLPLEPTIRDFHSEILAAYKKRKLPNFY